MLCCPQGRQEKGEKSMKKEAWNEGWLVRHLNTNDAWQQITLPYDCMIHEQRSDDAEGGCNNGWFMGYDYELMKRFRCSDMQLKRRIRTYLELEAVYRQGEVYCNDQLVVKRDNGYLNLTGELTPYLREGENTVRVIAHNAQMPSARWYTGAGIYRPAWWYEVPKKHILLHSLRIKTISISPAKVQVSGQTSEAGTVTVEILDGTKSMTAGKTQSDGTFSIVLDVPNAVCWDTEHPQCYDCRVCFEEDVWQEWFGIRTISCDAKNGFCLNGQRVLLRGACIHHDNGLLGAAEYPDAVERKVQLLKSVEMVDQNPIGKSSRSNPVTYIKAYDEIRKLFSDQPYAQHNGLGASAFSFNIAGGRCEECQGEGMIKVSMQFMADVELVCEACGGRRFRDEVLEVKYRGKSIYDVLEMTVDDAIAFFGEESKKNATCRRIVERLQPLQGVGLGYIKLGQSSSTLSGGESQRVKLASFLTKDSAQGGVMFIFDEPTTGLHFHDISKLLAAFNALIQRGHTIVVVEHNMDIIKCADWIVDLGPEAGTAGGRVVFEGTPRELEKCTESHTGKFLRMRAKIMKNEK